MIQGGLGDPPKLPRGSGGDGWQPGTSGCTDARYLGRHRGPLPFARRGLVPGGTANVYGTERHPGVRYVEVASRGALGDIGCSMRRLRSVFDCRFCSTFSGALRVYAQRIVAWLDCAADVVLVHIRTGE